VCVDPGITLATKNNSCNEIECMHSAPIHPGGIDIFNETVVSSVFEILHSKCAWIAESQ